MYFPSERQHNLLITFLTESNKHIQCLENIKSRIMKGPVSFDGNFKLFFLISFITFSQRLPINCTERNMKIIERHTQNNLLMLNTDKNLAMYTLIMLVYQLCRLNISLNLLLLLLCYYYFYPICLFTKSQCSIYFYLRNASDLVSHALLFQRFKKSSAFTWKH
jgi:hypothetical protein